MSKFKSTKPISAVAKSDKRNNFFSYWTSATTTKRNLGLEISKKSFNCKIVYKERYRERQGDEDTKTPEPTSTVHRHGEQPPDCSSLRRSLKLLLLSLFAFWECLKLELNCFCHVNKEGCCTVHRFLWRRVPGESPHVPPPPFTIKGLVCTAILQKILLLLLMQLLDFRKICTSFCFSSFEESNESCSSSTQHPNSSPSYLNPQELSNTILGWFTRPPTPNWKHPTLGEKKISKTQRQQ